MAEFPALPLWTDAYLGDTRHLSTLEHGAYLLLLMTAWRSKDASLPDDDKYLARIAGLGPRQWAAIKPTIAEFFTVKDGAWFQLRLVDERQAMVSKRESAAANGRASALKRNGRHSTKRDESVQRNADSLNHTHTHKEEDEEESAGGCARESENFEMFEPQEIEADQVELIRVAWNLMAPEAGLVKWNKLTAARRAKLATRLNDHPLPEIVEAIGQIPTRPFLLGDNDRGWKADFEFFTRPDSVNRILEGKYRHGRSQARGHTPNPVIDLLRQARAYIAENAGTVGDGGGTADETNF